MVSQANSHSYVVTASNEKRHRSDSSSSPGSSSTHSRPQSFSNIPGRHRSLRAVSSNPPAPPHSSSSEPLIRRTYSVCSSVHSNTPLIRSDSSSSGQRYEEMRNTRVFIRRMPSPIIGRASSGRFRKTLHSTDSLCTGDSSEVFLPSEASFHNEPGSWRRDGSSRARTLRNPPSAAAEELSYASRTSSISDIMSSLPLHQSALAEEAMHAPRICNRPLSRHSIGEEATREHWRKLKELELQSERARRCSKLSSGFAPLMVFGGLVFVCIGISASTNTGKDKDRLRQLSAAPIFMGVFMLALGTFLIFTWFCCRSKARQIDHKVLHGSRHNSTSSQDNNNMIQALVAKLTKQRNDVAPSPTGSTRGAQKTKRVSVQLSNGLVLVREVPAPPESVVARETSV